MIGGTLMLSWGPYGGLYVKNSSAIKRICLGWVALTWVCLDIDYVLSDWKRLSDKEAGK